MSEFTRPHHKWCACDRCGHPHRPDCLCRECETGVKEPAATPAEVAASIARCGREMNQWLAKRGLLPECEHCAAVIRHKPLACRHCGAVTECMYDVGDLDDQHAHFELCSTCYRAGVQPAQSDRMRAAGWAP